MEAGGNSLRGLWHHISMAKGAGLPYILENVFLTEDDLPGIKEFFREKINKQERSLAKDQVQIQEVWAIDMLRNMAESNNGKIPLFDYLQRLSVQHNEYYVKTKNRALRTKEKLNLVDEEQVDPKSVKNVDLETALYNVGFDDKEDIDHISCLAWLKKHKGYVPIFATADRALYECKDIIYENTGVIVEDALYAVNTYQGVIKKPWPVRRA